MALAEVLRHQIVVYRANEIPLRVGNERASKVSLQISYAKFCLVLKTNLNMQ